MSIPLPKRTVFKGKEDVCSAFYLAYVNVSDFKSFYQEELIRGLELASGSKIDIFIHRREGSGLISYSTIGCI